MQTCCAGAPQPDLQPPRVSPAAPHMSSKPLARTWPFPLASGGADVEQGPGPSPRCPAKLRSQRAAGLTDLGALVPLSFRQEFLILRYLDKHSQLPEPQPSWLWPVCDHVNSHPRSLLSALLDLVGALALLLNLLPAAEPARGGAGPEAQPALHRWARHCLVTAPSATPGAG